METTKISCQENLGFGVRACELFLCFVTIVRVRAIVLTSLFSLFYVTGECHRFLHRGRATQNVYAGLSNKQFVNLELFLFLQMTTHGFICF